MLTRAFRNFAILASLLVLVGTVVRADSETRFSKSLTAEELSASGIGQLNSDQVAVLDALVRRDAAKARSAAALAPSRFTDRLSADERRNAGIDVLPDSQRSELDTLVQRLIAPPPPVSGASFGSSGSTTIPSVKLRRDPEIHGEVALMVAVGSHGYSAYGGGIALTYDDPQNRFSLGVAYSEIHEKGRYLWRDYYRPYDRAWVGRR